MAIKRSQAPQTEDEKAMESAIPATPGAEEDVRSAALGRLKDQLTMQLSPPKVEDPIFKLKKLKQSGVAYPLSVALADRSQPPPEARK